LSGVDAVVTHEWPIKTGRVAFSPDNSQLLQALPGGGVEVVNLATGVPQHIEGSANSTAMGPVGFDSVGDPVQLTFVSPSRLDVNSLTADPASVSLQLLQDSVGDDVSRRWEQASDDDRSRYVDALDAIAQSTPDLSRIVAWHGIPETESGPDTSSGVVCLWGTQSARVLRQIPSDQSSLAISPDGSVFGIARTDGNVDLYTADPDIPFATVATALNKLSAISIGLDPRYLRKDSDGPFSGYVLAAADEWGTVAVWDLSIPTPLNLFRKTIHTINAVRFSPDSRMLAVVGHRSTRIWDTFNGSHILNLGRTHYRPDVVWSPDGSMIAVPGDASGEIAGARAWDIEDGRGIQTLRGLSSSAARIVFSRDSKRIAALANDWTVAVWDVPADNLLRCFRVPEGHFVDNCGMQFSRDGTSFYFSAKTTMTHWDVATGALIKRWKLPDGRQDRIGITADGRVMLMRCDLRDVNSDPDPSVEPSPRVYYLRDMTEGGRIVAEWKDLPGKPFRITGTPDGQYFAFDGTDPDADPGANRVTVILNGHTGDEIWRGLTTNEAQNPQMPVAGTAGILLQRVQHANDDVISRLVRLSDGMETARLPIICNALSPSAKFGIHAGSEEQWCDLYDIGTSRRLVRLELPSLPSDYECNFSPDGRYAAWANQDGTVSVCNLKQINEQLKQVNAGW
jgi:WD40 repeat protein